VLEAAFLLLEFSSPSRRIFIGSHSLPPSLVRRIGPSDTCGLGRSLESQVGHGRKQEGELTGGANGGRQRLARAREGKGEGVLYARGRAEAVAR
jgi:hypothetical protein